VALPSEVDKHTYSIRKRQPIAVEGVKRSSTTSRGGFVVPNLPMHTATHQEHHVGGELDGEGRQDNSVHPSVAETTSERLIPKSSVKKDQSTAPLRLSTKATANTSSGVKTAPPDITRSTSHQSPFEHVSTGADLFHLDEPRIAHLLDPVPPTQIMNPEATMGARRRKKSASARFSTMAVLEAPCRSSDFEGAEAHAALLRLWSDKTEQLRAQLNHVPSSSQTQASGSAQTISKEEYQNAPSSSIVVPLPSSRTRTTPTAHSHLEGAKISNEPVREFDLSSISRHQYVTSHELIRAVGNFSDRPGNAKAARAGRQSDARAIAAAKHDSTVTSFSSIRQYDAEPVPEEPLPGLDRRTGEDVPATMSRLRKPRPLETLATSAILSGPAASPTSPDDHKPSSPNGLPSPPFSPRGNTEKPSIAALLKQSVATDPPLRARSTRVVDHHSARHSRALDTPKNVTAPPMPISPSDETSSPATTSSSNSVSSDANTEQTSDGYSEHRTDKHPNPAGSSSSSHSTVPSSQSGALEAGYSGSVETSMEQHLSPSANSASESRCVSWVGFPVPIFPTREMSTHTREESVPIVETEPPPRRWSAIDWALEIPIPSKLSKWDLERMVWTHDLTHCEYNDREQLISATFFEFFRLLAYRPGWQYKDKLPRRDDDELRVAFWALFRHHLPASELLKFVRAVYRIYSDSRPATDYVQQTLDFFVDQLCTEWFGFWVKDTDEPIASDVEGFIREDVASHSKEYAERLLAAFRARNREGMFGSPYVLDVPPAYEKLPSALQLQLPLTLTMSAFELGPYFEEFVRQLTLVLHHAYKAMPPPMVLVLGWHFVVHDRGYVGPEQPFLDLCESLRRWVIYDITTAAADDLYPLVRFWLRVEYVRTARRTVMRTRTDGVRSAATSASTWLPLARSSRASTRRCVGSGGATHRMHGSSRARATAPSSRRSRAI
jgi:hypothetical protein